MDRVITLSTHTAKRKWVLYAADHFVAQCHEVTCETCNGYINHLINGVESGTIPSMPHNLAKALNEAWRDSMWDIHQDAHCKLRQELNSAHRALVLGKFGPGLIGTRSGLDQTPRSQCRSRIFPKTLDCLVSSLGIPILPKTVSDPVWTRTA